MTRTWNYKNCEIKNLWNILLQKFQITIKKNYDKNMKLLISEIAKLWNYKRKIGKIKNIKYNLEVLAIALSKTMYFIRTVTEYTLCDF